MFATFSRSWEFARMSYRLLWKHKRLILFPVLSSIAAMLVTASFALPLWRAGVLSGEGVQSIDGEFAVHSEPWMYAVAFLFYFANYLTVVFFNTGLVACVLKLINGEEVTVSYGISFAAKRLPQIVGWAFISAVVGVLLKAIENSHRRAGAFISAIFGSAWTALTYFVIPVIVVDGVGPVEAFKRSGRTLKQTWGTALVGNFSLGLFAFFLLLPVCALLGGIFWFAAVNESAVGMVAAIAIAVPAILTVASATSTADSIFKVFLFAHATGRTVPANVDTTRFAAAFRQTDND